MPNHVRNVWKIKNIKTEKEKEYILNKLSIVCSSHDDGSPEMSERIIDFDLIIPEPRFKKDCPKDYIMNKDSCIAEDRDRSWFDWYSWHIENWGTKWNAYAGYTIIGKTQLTFVFSTAWSFPTPIASTLEKLGHELDLRFADEDIGSNCGRLTFHPNKPEGKKWEVLSEKDIDNPEQFARYIWSHY